MHMIVANVLQRCIISQCFLGIAFFARTSAATISAISQLVCLVLFTSSFLTFCRAFSVILA